MTKKDIVRKLTSRKLWMAVAGFVAGLIVALGESSELRCWAICWPRDWPTAPVRAAPRPRKRKTASALNNYYIGRRDILPPLFSM